MTQILNDEVLNQNKTTSVCVFDSVVSTRCLRKMFDCFAVMFYINAQKHPVQSECSSTCTYSVPTIDT